MKRRLTFKLVFGGQGLALALMFFVIAAETTLYGAPWTILIGLPTAVFGVLALGWSIFVILFSNPNEKWR